MARISKVCHSAQCRGTKQPVGEMRFVPADPDMPSAGGHRMEAVCGTCGTTHPPDTNLEIADTKGWGAATKAANGGVIPIPLPRKEP